MYLFIHFFIDSSLVILGSLRRLRALETNQTRCSLPSAQSSSEHPSPDPLLSEGATARAGWSWRGNARAARSERGQGNAADAVGDARSVDGMGLIGVGSDQRQQLLQCL